MRNRNQKYAEFSLARMPDHSCTLVTLAHADLRSSSIVRILERDFVRVLDDLQTPRVVVDFAEVTVAPTAIFGIILQFVRDASERDIHVRLCSLAPPIRKAFELLNANRLVDIYTSRREAVLKPWTRRRWWPFG